MSILRRDDTVQDTLGRALPGAQVYYLSQPANVAALTPLATVYSDTLGTVAANPQTTDGFGHAVAYLTNGLLYTVVYVHPLLYNPAGYNGQSTWHYPTYPDQSLGSTAASVSITAGAPSGAINGSNVTFTLAVAPAVGLILTLNGITLTPGVGFNVSGTAVTMASPPQVGDALYALVFS